LDRLPRLIVLIGLVLMSALRTGIWAQAPAGSPMIDLWRSLRDAITTEGNKYFEQRRDTEIPPERRMFDGKVVSQPSPNELVVNVILPGTPL
jgi:hypothetical protein